MRDRMKSQYEAAMERQTYYTVRDIAAELRISYHKALDLVKNEQGVLNVGGRRRRCLRIPREVFERILRQVTI